jgi:hypothetical protein
MESRGYFYCALTTTLNVILNALSNRKYLWLEGRVKNGIFHNWAHRFRYKPANYAMPSKGDEQAIIDLIEQSSSVRLFGAAHSFNQGIHADQTLISLDNYAGIVPGGENVEKKQLTVYAGTRVRDVIQLLLDRGWAFKGLPSHNAQSIGGILSTDVHGTGRDWGWVSEMVVGIRLIDGNGKAFDLKPEDELFRAAIGGIGALGIISEVTVQARERFNIKQQCVISDFDQVESDLNQLIEDNEHMSLYVFPFTKLCQINKWNETKEPQSKLGAWREFFNISTDALTGVWIGNLIAYTGTLKFFSRIIYGLKKNTDLVLESAEGFSRTIYPLHQELEFTIPYEETIPRIKRLLEIFEELWAAEPRRLPYSFIEIRFTPCGHELSMIGPGRDRRSAWLDIICNDSHGFEIYYAAVEAFLKEIGGRPHLGKYCETIDKAHLEAVYGDHFKRFLELRDVYDPQRKFINPFTRRVFGD